MRIESNCSVDSMAVVKYFVRYHKCVDAYMHFFCSILATLAKSITLVVYIILFYVHIKYYFVSSLPSQHPMRNRRVCRKCLISLFELSSFFYFLFYLIIKHTFSYFSLFPYFSKVVLFYKNK